MIFVYSKKFEDGEYSYDPAATKSRFDSIREMIKKQENVIEPVPAKEEDVLRAHSKNIIFMVAILIEKMQSPFVKIIR